MCLKKINYIILYQMEFILFKHLSLHLFVLDLGLHLLNALFSMTDVFSATVR